MRDLRTNLRSLHDALRESVSDMEPSRYIQAQRYRRCMCLQQ